MHQCIKFILFWNDSLQVCLLAGTRQQADSSIWHMPVALCAVLNSWWRTERPSETCRQSFQNKIIWYTGASSWFYYSRCTAIWTSHGSSNWFYYTNNITMHGHMNFSYIKLWYSSLALLHLQDQHYDSYWSCTMPVADDTSSSSSRQQSHT